MAEYAAILSRIGQTNGIRAVCIHVSSVLNDVAEVARRAANGLWAVNASWSWTPLRRRRVSG